MKNKKMLQKRIKTKPLQDVLAWHFNDSLFFAVIKTYLQKQIPIYDMCCIQLSLDGSNNEIFKNHKTILKLIFMDWLYFFGDNRGA